MLDAAELKLRAERRLGELLAETVRPGNPQLSHDATIGRLPESVSRSESSRWQRAASIPEEKYEQHLAAAREQGEMTTAMVAAKIANMLQGRPEKSGKIAGLSQPPISQEEAADMMNVSSRSVRSAAKQIEG